MTGRYILLFGILIVVTACGGEGPDTEPIIQRRAAEQIAAVRANMLKRCQNEVLTAATLRADSLLLDRASRMRRIEGRPPKPVRPGSPPVKELSSPLPLRPLFPFEIRFDTLLRDSLLQDSLRLDSIRLDSLGLLPPVLTPSGR